MCHGAFLSFVFVENVLLRRQTVITKAISISSDLVILRLSYELLILLQSVFAGRERIIRKHETIFIRSSTHLGISPNGFIIEMGEHSFFTFYLSSTSSHDFVLNIKLMPKSVSFIICEYLISFYFI